MRILISIMALAATAYGADFTTYIAAGQSLYVNQSAIGALATDSEGDTYVTGGNAFVSKLDPAGNIVFTTTFGPLFIYSYGFSIAIDPSGNIWVGGQTAAYGFPAFPLVNPLQASSGPDGTGFVIKMASDGTLLYSSYFGGSLGSSSVTGIATDQTGNVYVTGWTDAVDFPVTPGLPASPVNPNKISYGVFATKLDSTGQKILYSTVITGSAACASCAVAKTVGSGIAVDGSGEALVVGTTDTDLPAIEGGASGPGAFVFKINAAGNGLVYFTYLPGSDTLGTRPIASDASGNAYVTGYTNNSKFPVTVPAGQYSGGTNPEAFAMKLTSTGATAWARFLLGHTDSNTPGGAAVTLDNANNVWLTGTKDPAAGSDADFVMELIADGSLVNDMVQFPLAEAGQDIAVDPNGLVHFAGPLGLVSTFTPGQPVYWRALSIVNAGSGQFSGTVASGEIISIYGSGLGPLAPVGATPQNGVFPTTLGGVQVLVDGAPIPLLYVSASQINAEIPLPVNGPENGIADIQVVNNSTALPHFRAGITTSVFGMFFRTGEELAITNQDGTLNSQANPAKVGSYVSLWATGFGPIRSTLDGSLAMAANNYCDSCQIQFVTGTFTATETVQYIGPSPGLIDGLIQINAMIPPYPQTFGLTQLQVVFNPPGIFPAFQGFVWVTE